MKNRLFLQLAFLLLLLVASSLQQLLQQQGLTALGEAQYVVGPGPTNVRLEWGTNEFVGIDNLNKCRLCQIDCYADVAANTWEDDSCEYEFFNYGCTKDFFCMNPTDFSYYERAVVVALCATFSKCKLRKNLLGEGISVDAAQRAFEEFQGKDFDTTQAGSFGSTPSTEKSVYTTNSIVKFISTTRDSETMCTLVRPTLVSFVHPGPAAIIRIKQALDILDTIQIYGNNKSKLSEKLAVYNQLFRQRLPAWFRTAYHLIDTTKEDNYITSETDYSTKPITKIKHADLYFLMQSNAEVKKLCQSWWDKRALKYDDLVPIVIQGIETFRTSINQEYYRRREAQAPDEYERNRMRDLLLRTITDSGRVKQTVTAVVNRIKEIQKEPFVVASGQSGPFKLDRRGLAYVDVDTSSHNLKHPVYFTTITGKSRHWRLLGVTSIYSSTSKGFRVYIKYDSGSFSVITASTPAETQWRLNWIAVPETFNQPLVRVGQSSLGDWTQIVADKQIATNFTTGLVGEQFVFTSLQATTAHYRVIGANGITRLSPGDYQVNLGPSFDNTLNVDDALRNSFRINYFAIRADNNRFFVGFTSQWENYISNNNNEGLQATVDLRAFNFKNKPLILTNLVGSNYQHLTGGVSALYDVSNIGFKVYVRFSPSALELYKKSSIPKLTVALAKQNNWRINWLVIPQE